MSNKKLILAASLLIVASSASISILVLEKKASAPAAIAKSNESAPPAEAEGKIILFYGDGCPHCLNVENFLNQNGALDKISYETKEVWNDTANRELMLQLAGDCGLKQGSIGVPFLWDGVSKKCLVGQDQVIAFFEAKLNSAASK